MAGQQEPHTLYDDNSQSEPWPALKTHQDHEHPQEHSKHPPATDIDLEMDRLRDMQDDEDDLSPDEDRELGYPRSHKKRLDDTEIDQPDYKDAGKRAFNHNVLVNGLLIASWYFFSVSISVYNKWMFADKELNFHFPLFTTSMHMLVQFLLSVLVLLAIPRLRPRHDSLDTPNSTSDPSKPLITPKFYLTRIAPCAAATGLDIGLGNTSLRYITLVFFTMCKSSTLGFVLLFAIIFRLEKPSWQLAGIIAVMTFGVIMMVAGETAFNALGFILLMMASFFSGLRWSLTQMLLRRNPATSNPFASLFFLTPIMFVILFIIAIPVEGFGPLSIRFQDLVDRKGFPFAFLIILTPGILAFCMTASEFALLKRTSVVTLSVCGIFKEVITIAAGGFIFGDTLTPVNISGLLVTIVAIAAYNWIRMRKMKRNAIKEAQLEQEENAPMLSTNDRRESNAQPPNALPPHATRDLIRRSLSLSGASPPPRILSKDSRPVHSPLNKPPQTMN